MNGELYAFDDWDLGHIVALIDSNTIDEMDTTAFTIRPSGSSGVADDEARIATDYVEVRVRYRVP